MGFISWSNSFGTKNASCFGRHRNKQANEKLADMQFLDFLFTFAALAIKECIQNTCSTYLILSEQMGQLVAVNQANRTVP